MKHPWIKRGTSYAAWAWLLLVVVTLDQTGIARAQNTPPMQLKITILDGEGSLNNIRERTAREPIVQVEDENHKPVAGALILFTIHGDGSAGATFANNLVTYQTTTDAAGRATAKGLQPNGQAGQITINVTATVGPVTASTTIHQVNAEPEAGTQYGQPGGEAAASLQRDGAEHSLCWCRCSGRCGSGLERRDIGPIEHDHYRRLGWCGASLIVERAGRSQEIARRS